MYNKHHSNETKERMSISHSGENHPMYGKHHSDKTKEKMRQAKIGKKLSDEHRKKLSEAHKGQKPSAETIEKRRQTRLRNKLKKIEQIELESQISQIICDGN